MSVGIEDIPKLYTALAEWLSCVIFVLLLKRRWSNAVTALLLTGSLALLSVLQIIIGIVPVGLWLPGMAVALTVMYGTLLLCCRISPVNAWFFWAVAFIAAEFAASLEWQFYSFVFQGYDCIPLRLLFLTIFYCGSFCLLFWVEKRQINTGREAELTAQEALPAAMVAVGAFLISNISYVNPNTPISGQVGMDVFIIRTLVDLAGTLMLIAFQEHWRQLQARREADAIHHLFQHQYEQYRQSQESIDMINRKYHDLKHQIGVLRMEPDAQKREEHLRQLESGLSSFTAVRHTGNAVLDAILAAKQMYCIDNNIQLNVVADGKQLSFLEVMDVCSVFGNALDNAIESVERLSDTEKRLIRLAVYVKNGLLMIRTDNYFETPLQKNGDEFETTKADKTGHGYGIKSIRYVAGKYGGSVSIGTEDGWFSLKVLIPVPDRSDDEKT